MLQISFYPEYIAKIFRFSLSNSLFSSWIVILILLILALLLKIKISSSSKKGSLLIIFDFFIEKSLEFTDKITQSRELSKKVFPLVMTFFIFIVTANLLGLVPGFLGALFIRTSQGKIPLFRSPNSDLNSTLALAIVAIGAVQYFGIKTLGVKKYFKRFFNFANPLKLIVGLFELLSDLTKILSLSLRLFGNILAGEFVLIVAAFFLPYFIPLPFMFLEVFVGVIQAFIFAVLSLVFIKVAESNY